MIELCLLAWAAKLDFDQESPMNNTGAIKKTRGTFMRFPEISFVSHEQMRSLIVT